MNLTTVIHIRDATPEDVYIGRANDFLKLPASIWGNPFVIGKHGTREDVLEAYREHIHVSPTLFGKLHELRGKRLACWCAPRGDTLTASDPHICHGQILAELADQILPPLGIKETTRDC